MTIDLNDPRLTAYALGELNETERREVEAALAESPGARAAVAEIRETAESLSSALRSEPMPRLAALERERIVGARSAHAGRTYQFGRVFVGLAATLMLVGFVGWLAVGSNYSRPLTVQVMKEMEIEKRANAHNVPTPAPVATVDTALHSPALVTPQIGDQKTLANLRRVPPTIQFQWMPLEETIRQISAAAGVSIGVEWVALEQAGIEKETTTSLSAAAMSFETALQSVLESVGGRAGTQLAYRISDGIVTISTAEAFSLADTKQASATSRPAESSRLVMYHNFDITGVSPSFTSTSSIVGQPTSSPLMAGLQVSPDPDASGNPSWTVPVAQPPLFSDQIAFDSRGYTLGALQTGAKQQQQSSSLGQGTWSSIIGSEATVPGFNGSSGGLGSGGGGLGGGGTQPAQNSSLYMTAREYAAGKNEFVPNNSPWQMAEPAAAASPSANTSAGLALDARNNNILGGAPVLKRSFSNTEPPGSGRGRDGWCATQRQGFNTESYTPVVDNPFLTATQNPLSTFSIDVDTASYAIVRRFLNGGQLPPPDAVRIEELVNYFSYDYPPPAGPAGDDAAPFSASMEISECPWATSHRLVRIGLKGRTIANDRRPKSNLVFLIDVSGSMDEPNKLPLVKRALQMLTSQLGENDRVAMVVYAGSSGLVLPSTTADHTQTIMNAIENLAAGGSTNGGEGINLAYNVAQQYFVKGGVNRVILCTDGDFNVGVTSPGDLTRLIDEKAKTGVFLSVFGFGMGNLKDSTLESLADKGNGNYGYIDTLNEARKVFVEQLSGTLVTIAKDVKIQVEFNPAKVAAYRLIGYENRLLRAEDFNNDQKDAGEIGAGHTVTAMYELVPVGQPIAGGVDPLKYQQPPAAAAATGSSESLTLKLRYKQPDGETSKLLEFPATDTGKGFAQASPDFQFAAAVAGFGMQLRNSPHKGSWTLNAVREVAQQSRGADPFGYRAEFIELVGKARGLAAR